MEMTNILSKQIQKHQKFIYLHTQYISREILDKIIETPVPIEIDVSIDENGKLYIGHPPKFYTLEGKIFKKSLGLDTVIKELSKLQNIFVVFDCKNEKCLNEIEKYTKVLGSQNCALSGFIKEFSGRPFEPDIEIEPHWDEEDLELKKVQNFREKTQIPVIGFIRALNYKRTTEKQLIIKAIQSSKNQFDSLGIFTKEPNLKFYEEYTRILQGQIIPVYNLDVLLSQRIKPQGVYIAYSDEISNCSRL